MCFAFGFCHKWTSQSVWFSVWDCFLVLFSIIFFGPSLDHIKQNKPSNLHYCLFFLSKPWYINSEKKSSEKNSSVKKIDLTYLPYFKLKKKLNKNKKKENRPTYSLPYLKFSSNSKHTYFFWPGLCKKMRFGHDILVSVNNRVISPFREDFIFKKSRENKTFPKISKFTVMMDRAIPCARGRLP